MLVARGKRVVGRGNLEWAVAFTSKLWSLITVRRGLVLDTRYVPAADGAPQAKACLFIMKSGVWQEVGTGDRRFEGPVAFILSKEQLEGAEGKRTCTYRTSGEPYEAIEIHVASSELLNVTSTPHIVELDAQAWQAVDAAISVARGEPEANLVRLVEVLAELGIVGEASAASASRAMPKPFLRLWKALQPMLENFLPSQTMDDISRDSGVSVRQADRDLGGFFGAMGFSGTGWRPLGRHIRFKLAVLLLSAEGATVNEVAHAVGYGSSDAMGRAFRDAQLPPPNVVQREVRSYPASGSGSTAPPP